MAKRLIGVISFLVIAWSCPGYADSIAFTNMELNGNAQLVASDTILRLTPAATNQTGSAFTQVSFTSGYSFSASFQFQISNQSGGGADGIVFVVQNDTLGLDAIGGGRNQGSDIGYDGTTRILNSLAVEFDTYKSTSSTYGYNDPNDRHVGILTGGSVVHPNSSSYTTSPGSFDNGNIWTAWVDYQQGSKTISVYLTEGASATKPSAAILTYILTTDLATLLGNSTTAYIGFTAATGGAYENQDIRSFQFSTVPLPGALLLLGAGLVRLTAYARRRF